jgi:hypothetical protein
MVDGLSRLAILERRARLLEAVRILQKEIACLDEEAARRTGRQKPELTEEFFWRNVFPVMVAEREIASGKLRRKLVESGLHVDDALFRTFLSRYRDKGFVELKGSISGRPKWKLTEAAFQMAAGRVSAD